MVLYRPLCSVYMLIKDPVYRLYVRLKYYLVCRFREGAVSGTPPPFREARNLKMWREVSERNARALALYSTWRCVSPWTLHITPNPSRYYYYYRCC